MLLLFVGVVIAPPRNVQYLKKKKTMRRERGRPWTGPFNLNKRGPLSKNLCTSKK